MKIELGNITRGEVAFGRPSDFTALLIIDGAPEFAVASDGEADGITVFERVGDRLTLGEIEELISARLPRLIIGGMSVDPTLGNLCVAIANWPEHQEGAAA